MEQRLDDESHRIMKAPRCHQGILNYNLVKATRMLTEQLLQVCLGGSIVKVQREALGVKMVVAGQR